MEKQEFINQIMPRKKKMTSALKNFLNRPELDFLGIGSLILICREIITKYILNLFILKFEWFNLLLIP